MDDPVPAKRARTTYRFTSDGAKIVKHVCGVLERGKYDQSAKIGSHRPIDRAEQLLGISLWSIYKLKRMNPEDLPEPGEPETRNRDMAMSEEDGGTIRLALAQLLEERYIVTLKTLQNRIRKIDFGWRWGITTLHKALKNRCGITFRKREDRRYERMMEEPDNVQRRIDYLSFWFDYHDEGREFVYMDESWLNFHMVKDKCWSDGTATYEPVVRSGKGGRWMVIGAGSRNGWVPNSLIMWKGKVASEEYHSEMNGDVFEEWFVGKLLPNVTEYVGRNAVIVIDRAPYHTMLTEDTKPAASNFSKSQLIDWLLAHQAVDSEGELYTRERFESEVLVTRGPSCRRERVRGWTKLELHKLAKEMKPKPTFKAQHWIDSWNSDKKTDLKLLILPVAHPILNPIEMMWGKIKRYVREHNTLYTAEHVKQLALLKVAEQGPEAWNNSFQHSAKYAATAWQAHLADEEQDPSEEEAEEASELSGSELDEES